MLLLLAIAMAFNYMLDDINNPNQKLALAVSENGDREIVLQLNKYGHYVATGKINGQTVDFILDTGATRVAVPDHIANQLDLPKGIGLQTKTANGMSQSYATRLNSVSLGDIVINNVQGSISMGMEFDEVLLGMSFLKHLTLVQQGNTLTVSVPE